MIITHTRILDILIKFRSSMLLQQSL